MSFKIISYIKKYKQQLKVIHEPHQQGICEGNCGHTRVHNCWRNTDEDRVCPFQGSPRWMPSGSWVWPCMLDASWHFGLTGNYICVLAIESSTLKMLWEKMCKWRKWYKYWFWWLTRKMRNGKTVFPLQYCLSLVARLPHLMYNHIFNSISKHVSSSTTKRNQCMHPNRQW